MVWGGRNGYDRIYNLFVLSIFRSGWGIFLKKKLAILKTYGSMVIMNLTQEDFQLILAARDKEIEGLKNSILKQKEEIKHLHLRIKSKFETQISDTLDYVYHSGSPQEYNEVHKILSKWNRYGVEL